jgi:hypothetical protein
MKKEIMPCDHLLENGDSAIMSVGRYYQCSICGEWWSFWEYQSIH